MVENQKKQKVKFLRSDNRDQYTSLEFKEFLAGEGIEHQLNISRWPEQNIVAVCMIGHLQSVPTV